MIFMNLTFIIQIISLGFVIFYAIAHYAPLDDATGYCGPFGSLTSTVSWYETIYERINENSTLSWIYDYIL